MKKYSTSLLIRKMQIKTKTRNYLILISMAITKMTRDNESWQGCREKETHTLLVGI